MIDSGHGGMDNGAVYRGRREKDDNLKVGLAVGEQLEKCRGITYYIQERRMYMIHPSKRRKKPIMRGADYFISFHRNSGEVPNTYHGAQGFSLFR